MKIILYDDYNRRFAPPRIIGTIRQTFGAWAFTNGWKIIEIYETDDDAESRRQGGGQMWSVKDYAFTIPANPMSDRVQLVIETHETEDNPDRKILQDLRG